jgi:signal transduction histidine kinase
VTVRTARSLAWGSFALAVVLTLLGMVFVVLAWDAPRPRTIFGPRGYALAIGLVFAGTGAVLASRRPTNAIGWIICCGGVLAAIQGLAEAYAEWILIDLGERSTLAVWSAWLDEWLWMGPVASLGLLAAIYPDGRWLSPRWRRAMVVAFALTLISVVATVLTPELVLFKGIENPIGVSGMSVEEYYRRVNWLTGLFLLPLVVGAAGAVVRFQRSRGDQRQQLKWLALSAALVSLTLAVYIVAALLVLDQAVTGGGSDLLEDLALLSFLTVPVAIAIGILKYRLYDIDVVISKTLIYGALALFITIVYVALVVGVGTAVGSRGDAVLSAIAAALVALAFQPVRRRAQRVADRFVYGERATPYEVLSGFSDRLGEAYSVEDVLPRLARVLAEGLGAERVAVWLRLGSSLRPAAAWPAGADPGPVPGFDALPDRAFEVGHQGEPLGAITVAMPPSEPLTPAQERLVSDVAAQAGLVMRNARLVSDLQESRRRIVNAQDERAKKLERDIHDGAQQQLVALALQLRLLEQQIERDPAGSRATAARLQTAVTTALDELRDLARGIYPPLLADEGLVAALEAQARKSPVPGSVASDGVGRYAPEIEAAVYFCVLEALQNVAKYAGATRVRIALSESDAALGFEVADDGGGFDLAEARGSGLQGMADRLEAVGGGLAITTAPGSGTVVRGSVPVPGERASR